MALWEATPAGHLGIGAAVDLSCRADLEATLGTRKSGRPDGIDPAWPKVDRNRSLLRPCYECGLLVGPSTPGAGKRCRCPQDEEVEGRWLTANIVTFAALAAGIAILFGVAYFGSPALIPTEISAAKTCVQGACSALRRPRRRVPPAVPFAGLLRANCERIAAKYSRQDVHIRWDIEIEGICPATHEAVVLRVVDELFCNAMEHGFYDLPAGNVLIRVASQPNLGVEVSVSDDGSGFEAGTIIEGSGFRLLRMIGDLRLNAPPACFTARAGVTVVIPFRSQWASNGREGGPPAGAHRSVDGETAMTTRTKSERDPGAGTSSG